MMIFDLKGGEIYCEICRNVRQMEDYISLWAEDTIENEIHVGAVHVLCGSVVDVTVSPFVEHVGLKCLSLLVKFDVVKLNTVL